MIYCDHNATTPLRPEVLEAMMPFLKAEFGNPSSVHALGSRARCAVEDARAQVAQLIGANPAEIVFTSGGTESNNLAIVGGARACGARLILSSATEHASVRESAAQLREDGCDARELPVDTKGQVAVDAVAAALQTGHTFVSVAWANNEVGSIQPIDAIAACCRAAAARFHVDAVQAAGKIPVSVAAVDLLSLSSHKLGGPKGVGALYVRKGVEVKALLLGGGQERGRRAGTENVAGIVGFGAACGLAQSELDAFAAACMVMREALWSGLSSRLAGVVRNSLDGNGCLPNTLHVSFDGVRGEALVAALDLLDIAVSSGSACAAGAGEPSHVLMAMGRDADAARNGVRFSFGRTNRGADVDHIIAATATAVGRIRLSRSLEARHG